MNTVFCARRRGVSLVECVILVIVLTIAVGSFFTTLAVAQRNYAYHIQDKRAREVLFAWNQAFESKWSGAFESRRNQTSDSGRGAWEAFVRNPNVSEINSEIGKTIIETNTGLNYTNRNGQWLAGPFIVSVDIPVPAELAGAVANGIIDLYITIKPGDGNRVPVNTARKSFNWYSTDTVSDDRVQAEG